MNVIVVLIIITIIQICVLNNSNIDIVYKVSLFFFVPSNLKIQFKIRFITAMKVSQGNMLRLLSLRFFFLSFFPHEYEIWSKLCITKASSLLTWAETKTSHSSQNAMVLIIESQAIIKNESLWKSCFIHIFSSSNLLWQQTNCVELPV